MKTPTRSRGRPVKERPELATRDLVHCVRELVHHHGTQQGLVDHIAGRISNRGRRQVPSRATIAAVLAGAPVTPRFVAALCHACDREMAVQVLRAYVRELLTQVRASYLPASPGSWDGSVDLIEVSMSKPGGLGYSVCVPQPDGKSVWRRAVRPDAGG